MPVQCALALVSAWEKVGRATSFLCPVRSMLGHLRTRVINRVNLNCRDLEEALGAFAFAVGVVLGVTGDSDDHLGGVALWAVHGVTRYQM